MKLKKKSPWQLCNKFIFTYVLYKMTCLVVLKGTVFRSKQNKTQALFFFINSEILNYF